MAGREPHRSWRAARAPGSALTNEGAGAWKGFHPGKKRTFRLLLVRLKIARSKEKSGLGVAAGSFLK